MSGYLWPNGTLDQPRVISSYGWRWHPIYNQWRMHYGVDLVGFRYNRSIADGTVTRVGIVPGWSGGGYAVWVKQGDGVLTKYLHGVHGSAFVKVGQRVKAGDRLSIMGDTGTADVVHLHLEISPHGGEGGQVDPMPFIRARLASPAGGDEEPIKLEEEEDMFRARSEKTGDYLIIGETSATRIKSADRERAAAYSHAAGRKFPTLPSTEVRWLLEDCAARQKTLLGKISDELAAVIADEG